MLNATNFIYDGVDSEDYGLMIASFDDEHVNTTQVFAPSLNITKASRANRFNYSSIKYEDSPEHRFSIISEDNIDGETRREILSWLTGRRGFKKLIIKQNDYLIANDADETNIDNYYYFNCIFTSVDIIYVNGWCHGFEVSAKFDSPYCYAVPAVYEYDRENITVEEIFPQDVYIYPVVEFTANGEGDSLTVTGGATGLPFELTQTATQPFASNSKIIVDNEKQIITGGNDYPASLDNFNLNWLALDNEHKELTVVTGGTLIIRVPRYALIGF